jgi:hypothetical protein
MLPGGGGGVDFRRPKIRSTLSGVGAIEGFQAKRAVFFLNAANKQYGWVQQEASEAVNTILAERLITR